MVGIGIAGCDGCGCGVPIWTPPPLETCTDEPLFCESLSLAFSTFSLFFRSELSTTICYTCDDCPYSGLGQQFELVLDPGGVFTDTYLQCDLGPIWSDIDAWLLFGADPSDDCFYGAWSGYASLETECTRNNVFGCENPPNPDVTTGLNFVWALVYVWRSGYAKVVILRACYAAEGSVSVDPGDPGLTVDGGAASLSVSTYVTNLNCCGDTQLASGPYSGFCTAGTVDVAFLCCGITLAQSYIRMNC